MLSVSLCCAVFILCFCFRDFLKEDGGGSFGQFIWVLILKSIEKPSAQIFLFFFLFVCIFNDFYIMYCTGWVVVFILKSPRKHLFTPSLPARTRMEPWFYFVYVEF